MKLDSPGPRRPEPPSRLRAFIEAHPTESMEVTVTANDGSQWTGHGYFMVIVGGRHVGPLVTGQLSVYEDTSEPAF